jgi:hypothetical protein
MTFQEDRSHAASSHSRKQRSSVVMSLAKQFTGRFSGRRAVIGLVVLAVLCTVAIGLQERHSAPLAAATHNSQVEAGLGTLPAERQVKAELRTQTWLRILGARLIQRAFWLKPWPWIGIGVLGFGGLAWALIWGSRTRGRD